MDGQNALGAATRAQAGEQRHTFASGAQRSTVMPRYDLIPRIALQREAIRFTGQMDSSGKPDGGSLKYGEGNWERGLPTSDVLNHAIEHLTRYADFFRLNLTIELNSFRSGDYIPYEKIMGEIQRRCQQFSMMDDHLAAVRWACAVLMSQETAGMWHDARFDRNRKETDQCSTSGTGSAGPSISADRVDDALDVLWPRQTARKHTTRGRRRSTRSSGTGKKTRTTTTSKSASGRRTK